MMRVGSHLSIAGGFRMAARSALDLGCEALQVFSRSPRGGKARALDAGDVGEFKALLASGGVTPVAVHVPYYVNLASDRPEVMEYTRSIVADDLRRAEALGASFVVSHLGHGGASDPLATSAAMIDSIMTLVPDNGVKLLLENTAGQGNEIGTDFRYIMRTIDATHFRERLGFCLDTCHAFAAGYDLSSRTGLEALLREIEHTLGFERLGIIHANDSKEPLGSHKDRHADIGEGFIGRDGFRLIMNTPEFDGKAAILETPLTTFHANLKNITALKQLRE